MKILSLIIIFASYMLVSTSSWIVRKFGEVTYEQLVFHSNIPLDTDARLIKSYFQNTFMVAIIVVLVFCYVLRKISLKKGFIASLVFSVFCLVYSFNVLNVKELLDEKNNHRKISTFYEMHYRDPLETKITSPQIKKNLILIFSESMETTYASKEYNGDNLIPELSEIAKDNINFSHNDELGGFYNLKVAGYTQASLIAQLCAVPLRLPIDSARYRPKNGFLPGATCLYDVLKKDDYNLSFMYGTLKESSGTDKFFATHGNPKILDWNFYTKRDNLVENKVEKKAAKYNSFFKKALRDEALFTYAKEELNELNKENKPFAFIIMTLDTHFGTEYFDAKNCETKYHDKDVPDNFNYKNVVSCSSSKIANFINYLKAQPFYDNTEIVIVGDHLTMGNNIFEKGADRAIYNVYMNPSHDMPSKIKNRKFTALDTMPTILESLGYEIDGGKLGLGTSLFSGKQTLLEEGMTVEELNYELEKQSHVYNKILYGKDVEASKK
ncbi:MAG: sulfatase-like hydrolase/transferase [Alphaproteobacteria bacterium]|nr:sulfatase-like hydrolase/transferase [Alphaproteobacteria bacterium]